MTASAFIDLTWGIPVVILMFLTMFNAGKWPDIIAAIGCLLWCATVMALAVLRDT